MKVDPTRVGIITVSDRSARGERPDASGPALNQAVTKLGWKVIRSTIIPDDLDQLVNTLIEWSDSSEFDLILTTGGTGLSPSDVTPEATLKVIQRLVPGIPEAMRSISAAINPHAMLSRAIAGTRYSTLIVNLPGSPKAAVENLAAFQEVIPHAVQLIRNDPSSEAGHFSASLTG